MLSLLQQLNCLHNPHTQDLNPDILNLCEVEGCDEVAWLAARLNEEEAHEADGGAGAYGYYLVRVYACMRVCMCVAITCYVSVCGLEMGWSLRRCGIP